MTMDQQAALERQRALYREKNAHLRQYLETVDPFEFYREIFPEGSFERKGHYEDAKGNAIALTVPKKQNSRENGVALEIEGDGRARRHLITDELQELGEIQDTDFTIMSPISYFGRQRSGKNARYLYAIVFDLIFMDIQMPTMNGYEAARAIRAASRSDAVRIPIIAITANAFSEDVKMALAAGMNAHIAKPFELKLLKKIIRQWLK